MTSGQKLNYSILLKRVTTLALYSRLCLLFLQIVLNLFIPDHQSDGFISPVTNITRRKADEIVHFLLGGLLRWDAQHFLHITTYGYMYEKSLAFFPGFPLIAKTFIYIFSFAGGFLNEVSIYLLTTITINIACFVLTSRILFHLTYDELKDEKVAYISSLFFCINPASIFFLAPYSETLFCLLSFSAMRYKNLLSSIILVAFSGLTRSNGIVNVGFPMYRLMQSYVISDKSTVRTLIFTGKAVFTCFLSSSTFFLYQIYSYTRFCVPLSSVFSLDNVINLVFKKDFILHNDLCSSYIPYFYIQKRYWNVGFLHYFELNQIPNFLLASPILSFCTFHCVHYLSKHWTLFFCFTSGSNQYKHDEKIFVYVAHLMFLLVVCFFFIHIQVSTRLLYSSSPAVYWFMAKSINLKKIKKQKVNLLDWINVLKTSHNMFLYCISYCIIGTALFSNFFPWT